MMAALFVIYIWIRCRMNPDLGPGVLILSHLRKNVAF